MVAGTAASCCDHCPFLGVRRGGFGLEPHAGKHGSLKFSDPKFFETPRPTFRPRGQASKCEGPTDTFKYQLLIRFLTEPWRYDPGIKELY